MADEIEPVEEEKKEPLGIGFWLAIVAIGGAAVAKYAHLEKKTSGLLLQIVVLCVGAALILLCLDDIRKGEFRFKRRRVNREENAFLFWVIVAFYILCGCLLFLIALSQSLAG